MSNLSLVSDEEAEFFHREGYLLIRSVFDPAEVAQLLAETQRVVDVATAKGTLTNEDYYHRNSFKVSNFLRRTRKFDHLIDHPGYFGKLVSLIGHHIQVMGTEVFVRGPAPEPITGFHTDLGEALQQILPSRDNLLLQVKAQVFLTDLSTPDASNFMLVPGSHVRRVPTPTLDCMLDDLNGPMAATGSVPDQAIQVLAKPGDVLIFPWTLWHAVGPNLSGRTRLSLTIRYGQLSLRPLDKLDFVLGDLDRDLTPRQRRLLGDLGPSLSPYKPVNQHAIIHGEQ